MTDQPRRCVIYCRISADRTGRAAGVDGQEKECRKLAQRLGLQLAAPPFIDNDVSAYARRRPQWEALLDLIASDGVDTLIAWHPDRLYRKPADLERLLDLLEDGRLPGMVRTCTAGDIDFATPSGRAVARTLVAWSNHEVEHGRERMLVGQRRLAEEGKPNGGPRRFGFEPDHITHRPSEVAMVREAAGRVLAGESLDSIVRDWKAKRLGGPKWPSSLRDLLLAPRTAGLRSHRGEVVGEAVWEPVLDREVWEQLRVVFSDPARRRRGGRHPDDGLPRRRYWLRGLLLCGLCGARMVSGKGNHGSARYGCPLPSAPAPGCGRVYVGADTVERYMSGLMLGRVEVSDLPDLHPDHADERADTMRALEAVNSRLGEIGERLGTGDLSMTVAMTAEKTALSEQDRLTRRLRDLSVPASMRAIPDDLTAAGWAKLTGDELHQIASWLLGAVVVNPGKRGPKFDPSRLEVRWADDLAVGNVA